MYVKFHLLPPGRRRKAVSCTKNYFLPPPMGRLNFHVLKLISSPLGKAKFHVLKIISSPLSG